MKAFLQNPQQCGLSPLWTLRCLLRLSFLLKSWLENLQWYGYSPVWTHLWISILLMELHFTGAAQLFVGPKVVSESLC